MSDERNRLLRPTTRHFASKHDQLGSVPWLDQLRAGWFLPASGCHQSGPSASAAPLCGDPSQCSTDTSVVSTASWALQKESVHNDFQATTIIHGHHDVQVAHKEVGGDSPSCLTADARGCALNCEPTPSEDPRLRARCTMMPKMSERRPHLHEREERGHGRRKRRRSNTRNNCDSILVRKLDGTADKLMPATGPLCDRNKARSRSEDCGIKFRSRCHSTLAAASCCHRVRWPPGSKSSTFLKVWSRAPREVCPNLGCRNHPAQ